MVVAGGINGEDTGLCWQDAYDKWCGDGSNNRHKTAHIMRGKGSRKVRQYCRKQGLEGVAGDKKHKNKLLMY